MNKHKEKNKGVEDNRINSNFEGRVALMMLVERSLELVNGVVKRLDTSNKGPTAKEAVSVERTLKTMRDEIDRALTKDVSGYDHRLENPLQAMEIYLHRMLQIGNIVDEILYDKGYSMISRSDWVDIVGNIERFQKTVEHLSEIERAKDDEE